MSAPFIGCTVASPAYHAHARVLAESFREHHPDETFVVLDLGLAGAGAGGVFETETEGVEVLDPATVVGSEAELERLGLAFTIQGLAGALKVRLLRHLLDRGDGSVLLIDSDICVYGELGDLGERAADEGAVLTTHLITPHEAAELPTLPAGTFNSGLIAVGEPGRALLEWWEARTARQCIFRPSEGQVWEQSWLALAPAFFEVGVLRDPGVNAMTRELLDRDIDWGDGRPHLAGSPLRAFHYSGPYSPHRPELLLSQAPEGVHVVVRPEAGTGVGAELAWLSLEDKPGALRMSETYAERLLAAGFDDAIGATPPFAREPSGRPLITAMRCAYRDALVKAERDGSEPPPNPFAGSSWVEFVAWLAAPPDPEAASKGLSRFAIGAWAALEVDSAFPDIRGADAEPFLQWLTEWIERDARGLPPRLHPGAGARRRRRRRMLRR
ncbi:MAG TPA: hypothetical protein VKA36_07195 [Solirubrobacterales bacterium]|nr:hypothetical protein [Solirubrobacterales bacterium]